MKKRFLTPCLIAAFVIGLSMPPAFAARKVSSWKKVAGHSTSCALVRASINSDNRRSGGEAANFYGCSASNSTRAVPPGYLGVYAMVLSSANNACSELSPVPVYNTVTTSSVTATMPLRTPSTSQCPEVSYYHGAAVGRRYLESSGDYEIARSYDSGAVAFLSVP